MAATDAMICKGESFSCSCDGTHFERGQEIARQGAENIGLEKQRQCAVPNGCRLQAEIMSCLQSEREIMSCLQSEVTDGEIPRSAGEEHSTTSIISFWVIIEAVSMVCSIPKDTVGQIADTLSRRGQPVNSETLLDKCALYEQFHASYVTGDDGCDENGLASGDSSNLTLTSASQSLLSLVQACESASSPSNDQRRLNCTLQKSPSAPSDNSSPYHRQSVSNSFENSLVPLPTTPGDYHFDNSTQSGLYNVSEDAGEDFTDGHNLESNDGLDRWLINDFTNPYVQISDSNLEYTGSALLSPPLPGVEHNMPVNKSEQYMLFNQLSNEKATMASRNTCEQVPIVQQNSVSGTSELTTNWSSEDGLSCGLIAVDKNLPISQNQQDIVCDGADHEISCKVNEPQNIQGTVRKTNKALKTLKDIEMFQIKFRLLEKEHELLENARLCHICHEKSREVTFLPCGHFITCEECAEPIYECPLCQKSVLATINTFLS